MDSLIPRGIVCLGLLAVWNPTLAGVKLLLEDGQRIEGVTMERKEDLYLLTVEPDSVLPIPVLLVAEIEWTGADAPAPGLTRAEPETLAGDPDAAKLPTLNEQIEALKDNLSVFRPSLIDPTWVPVSDWDTDPTRGNNFHPVHWYRSPIDFEWHPTSGLGVDRTQFNPVRWYRSPIDPTWWPTDGFSRGKRP